MKNMPTTIEASAVISSDQRYRYQLTRVWDTKLPRICFVMLNPSTADSEQDDPTIRRCLAFAVRWGYGSLVVANLYAFRTPEPALLYAEPDPCGPNNDAHISQAASQSDRTVVAWGVNCRDSARRQAALLLIKNPWCLGITKLGEPRHPLYVPGNTIPMPLPEIAVGEIS